MEKKICNICCKDFFVSPYRKNTARYCSRKCLHLSIKGNHFNDRRIEKVCLWCKKSFLVSPSRIKDGRDKYCSFLCYWASKKGKPSWNKGKKLSKEHRKKVLVSSLKGRIKQAQMKEPTSIEKIVYNYLYNKGITFEKQKPIGNRFIVDTYIPSLNLVIEIDGNYWHSTIRGIKTDERKNCYLSQKGYNLIRLSEDEVKNGNFKERIMI